MTIPWGQIEDIAKVLGGRKVSVLGCLSFERRCTSVPLWLADQRVDVKALYMVQIEPEKKGYPEFSVSVADCVRENREILESKGVRFTHLDAKLLQREDSMLETVDRFVEAAEGSTVLLDITSFPKRFFCIFVQQLLMLTSVRDVIVTYTQAGLSGYSERLAYSPMQPDFLPGFPFSIGEDNETLIVSVGYEVLGMRAIIESHAEVTSPKFLLSLSSDPIASRRQWNTLHFMRSLRSMDRLNNNLEVVAAWDSERVFQILQIWGQAADGRVILAPFGTKPHTLGMVLYACANDCTMVYTQPLSYNPKYTSGAGTVWAYVIKWDGIPCYQRVSRTV